MRVNSRSTVLVTGGAGFIGSELVRQLAARGEHVLIVDNLVNGTRANVEEVLSDKGKVRVSVALFGRPTSVELDYLQLKAH